MVATSHVLSVGVGVVSLLYFKAISHEPHSEV